MAKSQTRQLSYNSKRVDHMLSRARTKKFLLLLVLILVSAFGWLYVKNIQNTAPAPGEFQAGPPPLPAEFAP